MNQKDFIARVNHLAALTPEQQLAELLATIHGDGGHYTRRRGIAKSIAAAEDKWARATDPQKKVKINVTSSDWAETIDRAGEGRWRSTSKPMSLADSWANPVCEPRDVPGDVEKTLFFGSVFDRGSK